MTIFNIEAPHVGVSNFIKHALLDLKTRIDCSRVVLEDLNIPVSPID
jgi:hypothetical protein